MKHEARIYLTAWQPEKERNGKERVIDDRRRWWIAKESQSQRGSKQVTSRGPCHLPALYLDCTTTPKMQGFVSVLHE